MNKSFESFMAPQLKQFAAYRKQLGYQPDSIRSVLLDFDRYLQKQAVADPSRLTPEFFLELRAGIHEDPNTVNRVLSGLRALFAFLVRQGQYAGPRTTLFCSIHFYDAPNRSTASSRV